MAVARVTASLDEIPAAGWDALHDGGNPFVTHAFLAGMERCGVVRERLGWMPHHVTVWDSDRLVAAAPAYLKANSHGEFVFDHAWARAYEQHGLDYFPKWLCAIPYTPVTGPRLLARDGRWLEALPDTLLAMAREQDLPSVHVNFLSEADDAFFDNRWLPRMDLQYHWRNPSDGDGPAWRDFADFLAAMDHKHRKNIRQERAKVARAGIEFRIVHGDEAGEADLAAMHGFYLQTFAEYGNRPALTLDFLRHLARTMPRELVLFLAQRGGETIAGALCLRGTDTLYGRYWGASETVPGLHFETCYYQGIEYCLREGLHAFEPGAQGEHKLARGFLPTLTRSRHWLAHPAFAEALAPWCAEEATAVRRYAEMLRAHAPFRREAAA